ncbi:histidine ammonia-lyase [Lentzea sp. NPDC059081]|uniref:HAL/PAL/TAL family ammonia-lyase n=1 Tax=Lentzea sp. NPDC059081 TaxID=3346719 RepID=UPI003687EBC7
MLNLREPLTARLLELAAAPIAVEHDAVAAQRVKSGFEYLDRCFSDGRSIYGATTGFGPLVTFGGREVPEDQCDNTVQHLTAGQGPELPREVVRATMLARVWTLSRGLSGISPHTFDALVAALGTSFAPVVPALGSVGASGDLVPMAHIVQCLRGVGQAWVGDEKLPAAEALRRAGLSPLPLTGRDALALVNGTAVTSAVGGLAVASLRRSFETALALSALLTDVLGAAPAFLAPPLLEAFGHPTAAAVGERLGYWLEGTAPTGERPLQEPYSIRCVPQLAGAARSALDWAGDVVHRDLNGVSDNPLFFEEQDLVAHGGNFFGQPTAFAADLLSMVATQLGNLAERQLDLLVDPVRNTGLPPMLSPRPGEQHALQGVQLVTTAIVVAMRRACVPASVQSIPTNLHNQDVVPFGTQAALTALDQAHSLRLLHGSLALGLRQAAHLRPGTRAPRCHALLEVLSAAIPPVVTDRALDVDVRVAADVLDSAVAEHLERVREVR